MMGRCRRRADRAPGRGRAGEGSAWRRDLTGRFSWSVGIRVSADGPRQGPIVCSGRAHTPSHLQRPRCGCARSEPGYLVALHCLRAHSIRVGLSPPVARATPGHEADRVQRSTRRGGVRRSRPGAWSSVMAPCYMDGPRREMTRADLEKCGHGEDRPRGRLQVPTSRSPSAARRLRLTEKARRGKAAGPRSDTGRTLPKLQATVYSIAAPSCWGSISFEPRPSTLPASRTFSRECSLPRLCEERGRRKGGTHLFRDRSAH
jgi:hypothetical protein